MVTRYCTWMRLHSAGSRCFKGIKRKWSVCYISKSLYRRRRLLRRSYRWRATKRVRVIETQRIPLLGRHVRAQKGLICAPKGAQCRAIMQTELWRIICTRGGSFERQSTAQVPLRRSFPEHFWPKTIPLPWKGVGRDEQLISVKSSNFQSRVWEKVYYMCRFVSILSDFF